MPVPEELVQLTERFAENLDAYRSGLYKEAQLRQEFLDPFFKLLGWDVDNVEGSAEAYKDVIHEDSIKVGGGTEAPDYCFRIGGTRKFFVEAKKPSVYVKEEIPPAFQLRRYAWSAKLPLSILTDFEEFAVYDCRIKPVKTDKASTARIFYCTFREYPEHWDWIASIFTKEAIRKGSFDRFAESTKAKRGTAEVDKAFLAEIEGWREQLARNLLHRNPGLSQRDLNFAVQKIIDRIVFLRICEDRGIEPYGRLRAFAEGVGVYERLGVAFHEADERYNSGLFHFRREKERNEPPDELTPRLRVDDKILKEILRSLYYPESPYEFSVLPVDILGQVYEQFLGKVIVLKSPTRAEVEEKPEVRKAGGVFYTPTYIVDYIVKHTLGPFLEGRGPEDIRAGALRVLDPACGSGSFLLGAYQYLLDWHRDWYNANGPEKWSRGKNPRLVQTGSLAPRAAARGESRENGWRLTLPERKRILLDHIFGVDIDPQAVEVTKLSLLIKVVEGETGESLENQRTIYHERALPDLGANIKCGNSLIGPDIYRGRQMEMFDEEELYRINAFDWRREFPSAIASGGFQAVIGNPPYGASLTEDMRSYLSRMFEATSRDLDSYCLFIEQALKLAEGGGRISMIVPTGWYSGAKFSLLRRYVSTHSDPEVFVNLPYDVFRAWVDTTIFLVRKRTTPLIWPRRKKCAVSLKTFPKRHKIESAKEIELNTRKSELTSWFAGGGDEFLTYADTQATRLLAKIRDHGKPFHEFCDIQRGVTPFVTFPRPRSRNSRMAFNGALRRYSIEINCECYIRFDKDLAEPKPERYFQGSRILLRELISRQFRLQGVLVHDSFVTNKSVQSILARSGRPKLPYSLGLLNSRLMSWYFLRISNVAQRDDFPKIVLKETRNLPIRPIDFSDKKDRARHERMVSLVERMLDLHKRLPEAKTDHAKTLLQRQIEATDTEIDELVYDLYELTPEEIRIIEEGF